MNPMSCHFALCIFHFSICTDFLLPLSLPQGSLHNSKMSSGLIPVNRWSIGLIAASCFALAAAIEYGVGGSGAELWSGSLSRVGVVMCTVWIALPNLMRDTSRMQVSWQTGLGVLLAIL